MATSGYIKSIYYPNLFGENGSSDPNQHVLKMIQGTPLLTGSQTILTYVSEKANGEFVTNGYEPHNHTESWCFAGDYLKPKEKIPKKNRKCPHEGIEGVLGLVK